MVKVIRELACKKPVVNIHRSFNKVYVELEFGTHLDVDLDMMNSLLSNTYAAANSLEEGTDQFSLVTLSIVPEKYAGYFYIIATDPMFWALTADNPRSELNTLRFVFDENDFFVMEADEEDVEAAREEALQDMEAEERKQGFYEEKAGERGRFG